MLKSPFTALRVVIVLLAFAGASASAQSPRTIKIIVPSPAGDTTDILSRMMADKISQAHGVTFVVENRPGAGNQIGIEAVFRAPPDGNTLLMATNSFAIGAHLKKLPYNPLSDFEPICHLVNSPQLLAVNSASSFRTLPDLIDAAHVKPNTLTLGAVGPGTAAHIGFEMLKRAAKLEMQFVAFPGNPPAMTAVLGQHVTGVITGYASSAPLITSNQLRALVIGTRIPQLPDVKSFTDYGYKDVEVNNWFGVIAPAKTPKDKLSQLERWFKEALQAPEVQVKLESLRLFPVGACGADFVAHIGMQYDKAGRAVREANLALQ